MIVEFDHNTSNIDHFNNELSLLLSHHKLIADDKKLSSDFVRQLTYIVELLNKNQAPKNLVTKARVRFIHEM